MLESKLLRQTEPDRVFIAVNGVPWFNRNRIARSQFERIWKPPGNGLVCWKKWLTAKRSARPEEFIFSGLV